MCLRYQQARRWHTTGDMINWWISSNGANDVHCLASASLAQFRPKKVRHHAGRLCSRIVNVRLWRSTIASSNRAGRQLIIQVESASLASSREFASTLGPR